MRRFLRWLFGITVTAVEVVELKEGDFLLVTPPPDRRMSPVEAMACREILEQHVGKRVIIAEPGFDLTVIRPPGD